jgi:hypothetical protein
MPSPTTISQADADRANAFRTIFLNILQNGCTGATLNPVSSPAGDHTGLNGAGPIGTGAPLSTLGTLLDTWEAALIAFVRLMETGDSTTPPQPFPEKLGQFVRTALPSVTQWEGSWIYVTNAVGGKCPAWSNGTNWISIITNAPV